MGLSLGAKTDRSDIFYPKRQYNVVLDLVHTNKLGALDILIINLSQQQKQQQQQLQQQQQPPYDLCLECEFFYVVNFTMFWPLATTSCGNLRLQIVSF